MRLDEITGTLDRPYFSTYSAAVRHARLQAEKQGFTVSDNDWDSSVTTGPGKPAPGKTVRHNIPLQSETGEPSGKSLAIQVFNRDVDTTPYELNFYITAMHQ